READRGGGADRDQEHEQHQAPAGFDDLEELAQNHEGIPLWISPGRRHAARLSCDLARIITGALPAGPWQTAQAAIKRPGSWASPKNSIDIVRRQHFRMIKILPHLTDGQGSPWPLWPPGSPLPRRRRGTQNPYQAQRTANSSAKLYHCKA